MPVMNCDRRLARRKLECARLALERATTEFKELHRKLLARAGEVARGAATKARMPTAADMAKLQQLNAVVERARRYLKGLKAEMNPRPARDARRRLGRSVRERAAAVVRQIEKTRI